MSLEKVIENGYVPGSDNERERECAGKKAHGTIEAAEYEARRLRMKIGDIFNAYACKWCNKFHVGTDRCSTQDEIAARLASEKTHEPVKRKKRGKSWRPKGPRSGVCPVCGVTATVGSDQAFVYHLAGATICAGSKTLLSPSRAATAGNQ